MQTSLNDDISDSYNTITMKYNGLWDDIVNC